MGYMPVCSLACRGENASGVVALVVTSWNTPDQAKHGLEFVPAAFAHILLVDRVAPTAHAPIVTFNELQDGQRTTPSSTVRVRHSSEDSTTVSPG
ncbi:hypothetical protein B0G76_5931 [Paraburkholderia sp. BL23I1N1]|nr:hypothetical protein B0G76_5931 [Paraburkholderia sp. BL23I1N1]